MTKSNESESARQALQYRRDTDKLVPREKLPDELQQLVDDEDSLLDQIYDGTFVLKIIEIELHYLLLTIIQGQINHGLIPPLRSLRHSSPNPSSQRPPLCCIYLRHWRVLSPNRPSMVDQVSIWRIMGLSNWRCRLRRLQGLPREPTNPVPSNSRSESMGYTENGK